MTFVSTGGGATLEYLAGNKLPGLEALKWETNMLEGKEQPKVPDTEKTTPPLLDEQQRSQWARMIENNYFKEVEWPELFVQSKEFQDYVAKPEVIANIKRSIIYTPEKIFSYYLRVLPAELVNSICTSPEVCKGVRKEIETVLDYVSDRKFTERGKNVKNLLIIFPEISNDSAILKKAQDELMVQVGSYSSHPNGRRLEIILYLVETFDLPKDFIQSPEVLSIFPIILKSNETNAIVTAKKIGVAFGLTDDQMKKMALESIVPFLANYTQNWSSYVDSTLSVGLKKVQQAFGINEEELGLKDRVPVAIEKAFKERGYVGLFFEKITDLIHEHNVQLEIPPEWEELANNRAENNINTNINAGYNVGELRRLIGFMRDVGISIDIQKIKNLLETKIKTSISRGYHNLGRDENSHATKAMLELARKYNLGVDENQIFQELVGWKKKIDTDMFNIVDYLELKVDYENFDPKIQEIIKNTIKSEFSSGKYVEGITAANKLNIPKKISISFFKEMVASNITDGTFTPGLFDEETLKQVGISGKEIYQEKQFIESAQDGLLKAVNSGDIKATFTWGENLKNLLGLDDSTIKQIYGEVDGFSVIYDWVLIKFIPTLGSEQAKELLPKTYQKVLEQISSKILYDQDLADYFLENLTNYYQQPWVAENVAKAVQQYSIARKFIDATQDEQTIWKNEPWVADTLAQATTTVKGEEEEWDQKQDSHENEGFSESDPFANHPWCFGGRQIRIASAISELMAGKTNAQGLKELGINSKEISPLLAEANEKVNTAYQNFLEQIRSNTSIKDDDKQALLNPESSSVKMTVLLENIRSFVARYFVQSVEGDVTRLSEIGNLSGDLDRILAGGFRRYIKIHEVDVPLYDKLYEEFDTLRETGRSPLEVYLGRDGIYAYIGRHSQDVARRRKLGLKGRKRLKEMGEVVEIHPQYIVYPRYFRDNINQETKRQFLEQEGISPDADPLFYDTGYTGTIPEQIMRIMDFSGEDIERRIRLLSAPSVHRRVKGILENSRSEIIEYIEYNAKTEETAIGLIIDEKTGKIRHIAKPTNPEEQFYFMMVKQAIARHYWVQEKLHHEPSGNINMDSEHYTIRIRQEYAKLLPQEFLHDPKSFFAQQELLKGSKGEGEYPDEEVVLFKLSDGTEIVAKRIELRKSKEARKEFSILIAAKKAGLPTAEPVGFLSGKEDKDGSYLLMKKIEGRSGRKFAKELQASGKYSDEQIKTIMRQVTDKNKEMAELFRTTLKIDKRWRIKDTIIEFNEETGEVGNIIPIDWERAEEYNPSSPREIDEIN